MTMKVQYEREQGSYVVKEGHLSFCTRTLGWGMIAGFGSDLGCSMFQKTQEAWEMFLFLQASFLATLDLFL